MELKEWPHSMIRIQSWPHVFMHITCLHFTWILQSFHKWEDHFNHMLETSGIIYSKMANWNGRYNICSSIRKAYHHFVELDTWGTRRWNELEYGRSTEKKWHLILLNLLIHENGMPIHSFRCFIANLDLL